MHSRVPPNRSHTPGCSPGIIRHTPMGSMSISTKVKMYNMHVCQRNFGSRNDTEDSTPENTDPLVKVPPHLSPKGFMSQPKGFSARGNCRSASANMGLRQVKINLGSENIEDEAERPAVQAIRYSKRTSLFSGRHTPSPSTTTERAMVAEAASTTAAGCIPALKCNSLNEIKIRVKSARVWLNPHNLPHTSTSTRTLREIPRKSPIVPLRAVKEGYLWKRSSKFPNKWKPRYCAVINHAFIWTTHRNDRKIKGCIQFDRLPGLVRVSALEGSTTFMYCSKFFLC